MYSDVSYKIGQKDPFRLDRFNDIMEWGEVGNFGELDGEMASLPGGVGK